MDELNATMVVIIERFTVDFESPIKRRYQPCTYGRAMSWFRKLGPIKIQRVDILSVETGRYMSWVA